MSLLDKVKRGKAKGFSSEEADTAALLSGRVDDVDKKINAATKDVTAVRTDLSQIKTMLSGFLDEYKSWKTQITSKVQNMEAATAPATAAPQPAPAGSGTPQQPVAATAVPTAPVQPAVPSTPTATSAEDLQKVAEALTNAARMINDQAQKMKAAGASQSPGSGQ